MTRIPHRFLACALALGLITVSPPPSHAQQAGHLTGTVKDLGGRGIKGAAIRAFNPGAIPNEFNVTSDPRGNWGMLGLQAGVWEVIASAPGFENSTVTVRVSVLRTNPKVAFVLVGAPAQGALEGVDTKALQADLGAAETLMADAKWDEAIAAYRAILAKAPPLTMVNLAIGQALRMKQDYAAAAAAYEDILKGDASNQKALLELARARQEGGDAAAGVAILERLLAIDGRTDEALEARALIERWKK